ncbi:MAG: hypothetical protein QM779_11745 [Propionicimonas sp.]|uniref:hypothetical protein n=1 Tax=Propionicimonas sp. TaxID=1955623 RepID=UPI003D12D86F
MPDPVVPGAVVAGASVSTCLGCFLVGGSAILECWVGRLSFQPMSMTSGSVRRRPPGWWMLREARVNLGVAVGVAEVVEGDLGEDVALLHRVVLVSRLGVFGVRGVRPVRLGWCGWRGCERCRLCGERGGRAEGGAGVDEQRQAGGDQATGQPLGEGEAGQAGRAEVADRGDEFGADDDQEHGPHDPAGNLQQGQEQGAVVGSQ